MPRSRLLRSRRLHGALAAALLAATALVRPPAAAQELPTDPEDLFFAVVEALGVLVPDHLPDPLDLLDPLNPACDRLDTSMCLLPFPSDEWTAPDPSTPTGRRVDLPLLAMPRNLYGKPVDPTEWNRNDGFSPGSALLTHVRGLDLARTWGLDGRPERYRDQITDLSASLRPDAPIVLVDAATGERHPFFSELDGHESTPRDARTLIVRPAVNLRHGHRYVVGLRDLRRSDGSEIGPGEAFAALRDGTAGGARQARYDEEVFPVLADAGVPREELALAWDLTVVSSENVAGRVLSMRDETLASLGDRTPGDGVVDGAPPAFSVDEIEPVGDPDHETLRVVRGTVSVPNYLSEVPGLELPVPGIADFALPGARLNSPGLVPGPDAHPVVNALFPTRDVPFVCSVPRTVLEAPAVPTLYGHGLLGSQDESTGSSTSGLRRSGYMPCAVDWTGMSTGDLPNVALILQDISLFPSLADRSQQGFLDFLVLGRALSHPAGLAAHPAFQDRDGEPVFDPDGLVFDGNSQGAILGGALAALGVDFTRVVLGVPGMNYSTLLNRSVDWEGVYGELSYAFYPNKIEQQVMFGLIQMLWDRGETNGYAQHLTSDPLPGTPPKQVLLQTAFGDHQVANIAAEVQARTIDARRIPTDLPACRHWSLDPMFGFEANDPAARHPAVLAYFDSGTPTPPNGNTPPAGLGEDPHSDPRNDPRAIEQKITFYETGRVIDPSAGAHARTDRWPERAAGLLPRVEAQLDGGCLAEARAPSPTRQVAEGAPDEPPAAADPSPEPGSGSGSELPATGGGPSPGPAGLLLAAALVALASRSGMRLRALRG